MGRHPKPYTRTDARENCFLRHITPALEETLHEVRGRFPASVVGGPQLFHFDFPEFGGQGRGDLLGKATGCHG